ncbi:hypothetical protein KKI93_25540, partial [Xenorhabdus bovienii]|uniref:TcdA/TcdB pore-forming domain-containing protein n=1 Tax=Xenorhabdus bovienii TaxID=40576 RepID=UPI0023B346CB
QERVAEDTQLRTTLVTLEAEQWGAKFDGAIIRLAQENKLDSCWMPVIGNIEDQGEDRYRIQFINRDNLDETRWVSSNDVTFVKFRRFIDK